MTTASVEQKHPFIDTSPVIRLSPPTELRDHSVRPRRRIVGGSQTLALQFILLAVVHATGSKGLPSPDITTSGSPSTLAATEEGECGKDNIPETHNADGDDKSDDETFVLTVFAKVEVAIHTVVVAEVGVGIVGGGIVGVGVVVVVGRGRVGSRPVFLMLFSGLADTGDATAFVTFLESVSDVIGDLYNQRLR